MRQRLAAAGWSIPSDFAFAHALTRDAAYGALLSHNRRVLHSLAADSLASRLIPGTALEWELLPPLVEHLEGAERYREAHERACRLLRLNADVMNQAGQEHWLARAVALWRREFPQAAEPGVDPYPPSASLLLAVTEGHWRRGEYPPAWRLARRALDLAQASKDGANIALALRTLGVLAHDQLWLEEAEEHYRASISTLEEHGLATDSERGMAQMNIGLVRDEQGRPAEARALYAEALALFRRAGDRRGQAYALNNEGCLLEELGQPQEARRCWEGALEICRELGDLRSEASLRPSLALLLLAEGQLDRAEEMCRAALALAHSLGDPRGEAYALDTLGRILAAAGGTSEARGLFHSALALRRALGDPQGEALVLSHLAALPDPAPGGLC